MGGGDIPAEKLCHSNEGHFADTGGHKVEAASLDVEDVNPILHLQNILLCTLTFETVKRRR